MPSIAETLLKFKIAQLEGQRAIYESLIVEISQLESIEKTTFNVKRKLENVVRAWERRKAEETHAL